MAFELVVVNKVIEGKSDEYVRWRVADGPEVDYVGLPMPFKTITDWVVRDHNFQIKVGVKLPKGFDFDVYQILENIEEDKINQGGVQARYYYILESDLYKNFGNGQNMSNWLTVYSDNYSINFINPTNINAFVRQCTTLEDRGVNMLLKAYNAASSNPFGRYDNSPNDAPRFFVFEDQAIKNNTTNDLNALRPGTILTQYSIYLSNEYKGNTNLIASNETSSESLFYNIDINKGSIVRITLPTENKIAEVHNNLFGVGDFTLDKPAKEVITNSSITSLRLSAFFGRKDSQFKIMNQNSANAVAEALGIRGGGINLDYEWLHLSAFSFGKPQNLDSAQDKDNLVLGTSAANSQMLLFETQIQNTLRIAGGMYNANIYVVGSCPFPADDGYDDSYVAWYATEINYDVNFSLGDVTKHNKRRRTDGNSNFKFSVIFNPFQTTTPTVVEQQIVKSLLTALRNTFDQNKKSKPNTLITAVHPSLQRLLVRRPSKPVPHQLESVNVNLFGKTNLPAIRETRHNIQLTTVDTPYLVPGDQPFSFAQLFGNVLEGTSWLCFNSARFTVREEDGQVYLEFDGNLIMDPPPVPALDPDQEQDQELARQALIAFKNLLEHATGTPGYEITTLTVGGGLLLKNEITSWEDLQNTPDPSYIDLGAAAAFTLPLVDNSIVLTNLGLEVTIFRKINLTRLGEGINALNLPEDWTTWVFLSGAVEFHNLNSPEPVVLQAELRYTSENIMVNASVSGVQNLFGLEALSFDYLGAQFVYGQNPEVALRAIYTPFAKSFEFGGIMSSAGVGIYCNAEEFDLNDINDIFNSLTGVDLHLPEWDMTFENVRISLATDDGLVIGPETLNRGLFISATVRIRDYAASVIGEFTPNGVYFEGLVTEMVENPLLIEGMTLNSLRLIIDLNKTASDFMFSGEMSYSGLTLDCSVHVEKAGETWNETLYAEIHSPSFGLSTLFPSTANSILDTLRFSDAAIIISNYDGTYYKGDTLYDVTHGVHLKCTLEEIPFISALIHSRQIGLQLSADLGVTNTRLGITMPQSTALQLGNAVRCEPFSIYAYLTPTPNLMLDFGFSLINIPNQDPLRFDLSLDVGVAEAEAAATMKGTIENFMGITGLEVGPELGLEVGIIYEQFAVSGIPSELALAAGASYAGTSVDFALKISENPDEEITYAHVGDVSVNTLVNMIETFIPQIGAVQVPNFLTINDMTLYCAPMGGQIGVLKFEPGMNFTASIILGITPVDIMAYFSKNGYTDASGMPHSPGLYAYGKVQRFNLGPLTVTGLKGQDAEVSLAIAGAKSQLHVDCAIEFYGMLCGGYLDIGNDQVTFEAKLVLTDILFIDLTGNGQFTNGRLTDFQVNGVLHNNFNNYLANLVINKLNQGFAYLEHAIDALQNKVDEADRALNNALNAVNAALAEKEAQVQTYLHDCQDKLSRAQKQMDDAIQVAMEDVEKKKASFDRVFDNAKQDVQNAQNAFDAKMRAAEADLEDARRDFDNRMKRAQKDLDKAQGKCDAALGNAIAAVTAARNKVDGLNRDKIEAQKQVDDSHWYSEGYYEAKLLAIEATIGIAKGILNAAIDALSTIQGGIDVTLTNAQNIFNNARLDADKVIQDAENLLDDVRRGTEYGLLQQAQNALSIIETGADYTVWKAAETALEGVRKVEQDLVDAAQYAIDNIAETAVYHAFKLAEDTVSAVQNGPLAAAYYAATSALTAASKDVDKMNKFADDLVKAGSEALYFNSITVEAMYSSAKIGLFSCEVVLIVLGDYNTISMELDLNKMENFAQNIYNAMLLEIE